MAKTRDGNQRDDKSVHGDDGAEQASKGTIPISV